MHNIGLTADKETRHGIASQDTVHHWTRFNPIHRKNNRLRHNPDHICNNEIYSSSLQTLDFIHVVMLKLALHVFNLGNNEQNCFENDTIKPLWYK